MRLWALPIPDPPRIHLRNSSRHLVSGDLVVDLTSRV
jgi:hypothetical protein